MASTTYSRHHQASAIDFINYVVKKFPFRISTIRTDRGHEFQAQFHWHVADQGMEHVYIKPRTPQLNGKVERSQRKDSIRSLERKATLANKVQLDSSYHSSAHEALSHACSQVS
jgi:transposase InsO family protein